MRGLATVLVCFWCVTSFCQSTSKYQPGTIMAVVARPSDSADATTATYDISVRVGDTIYVVLYTPPLGAGTPQYAAGRELLVKVGEKTITFNDMLGQSRDVPIESSSPAEQTASQRAALEKAEPPIKATLVTGLSGFKDNSSGRLSVEKGNLHFVRADTAVDIAASEITDLITGNDSQRAIGGKAGTVSTFGPYGSGRFLSLFRSKLDTLTLEYRDADHALHGVIFTMANGQAEPLKQQIIALGAHTTAGAENGSNAGDTKLSGAGEDK